MSRVKTMARVKTEEVDKTTKTGRPQKEAIPMRTGRAVGLARVRAWKVARAAPAGSRSKTSRRI